MSIAAGGRHTGGHTCAVTEAGGVLCWGANGEGQLGNRIGGKSGDRSLTPVPVRGLKHGVTALTAGSYHTCVLTNKGGVLCWGNNRTGQLGDGTSGEDNERLTPVQVRGLERGVTAIAAGGDNTCVITETGSVLCWGDTSTEQNVQLTPVPVHGLESGVTAIAAGRSHTCALLEDDSVRCWGANEEGQLGNGTREDSVVLVEVALEQPIRQPEILTNNLTETPNVAPDATENTYYLPLIGDFMEE